MKGIDFSWARPGGAAIKAAGNEFVMRYVPYPGDGGKGLTAAEVEDYRANGLDIGLVFESTAARHLAGFGAGAVDGLQSMKSAKALGFPDDCAVYFAVDFDASADQMTIIDDYQRGAASILTAARVGIYGSYRVIDLTSLSNTTWLWQTYAWSHGQEHPRRHVYQYENGVTLNGGEVDLCEAYGTEQGLWKAQEEEMGMTAEERADLDAFKRAVFAGKEQPGTDEERTAYANFKIGENSQSVNDTAQSAIVVALGSTGAVQPGMKPDEVQAIIDRELSKARIIVTGG